MQILALDTSMGACSASFLRADASAGSRLLVTAEELMQRGHAEALMPMVEQVMSEAGARFTDLDLIAATVGPGSFTGVRIAIAAARGFALVTKARLWGTDSLTVMARRALGRGLVGRSGRPFAVAVDAHRGMLYLGLYDGKGQRVEGPLLVTPGQAAGLLSPEIEIAVGSGATTLAAAAAAMGHRLQPLLPDLQPSATALAELALQADGDMPHLKPLYLRPPDAKPQIGKAVLRQ